MQCTISYNKISSTVDPRRFVDSSIASDCARTPGEVGRSWEKRTTPVSIFHQEAHIADINLPPRLQASTLTSITYDIFGSFIIKFKTWHLVVFSGNNHSRHQFSTASKSSCITFEERLYIFVSSAKRAYGDLRSRGGSDVYKRKRMGPQTDPCGTPLVNRTSSDEWTSGIPTLYWRGKP